MRRSLGTIHQARVPGADAGRDHRHRALASRRPTRTDRDRRCQELDRRNARPHDARVPMKCLDHRVGAVSLRFRREAFDDQAHDQPADGHRNRHEPESRAPDYLDAGVAFREQAWRVVSGELPEEEPRGEPRPEREQDRRRGAGRTEDDRVEHELPLARALGGKTPENGRSGSRQEGVAE
jgi:hypothetical protein